MGAKDSKGSIFRAPKERNCQAEVYGSIDILPK